MLLVLVCSAITTASKTRDESFAVTVVRNQVEVFFFALFLSEAVLKITALGPKEYKRDKWNRFDFACVFFSFLDVTCEAFLGAALGNSGNSDGYSGNSYGNDGYRYDVTAGEASPLTTEQIVYLTTTRFLGSESPHRAEDNKTRPRVTCFARNPSRVTARVLERGRVGVVAVLYLCIRGSDHVRHHRQRYGLLRGSQIHHTYVLPLTRL